MLEFLLIYRRLALLLPVTGLILLLGAFVAADTSVTANALLGGPISLSWLAIGSAGDVLAPMPDSYVTYELYRATTNVFSSETVAWITQNMTPISSNIAIPRLTTTVNYIDTTGLIDSQLYYYQVLAKDNYLVSFGIVSYNIVSATSAFFKNHQVRAGVSLNVVMPLQVYSSDSVLNLEILTSADFRTLYTPISDNSYITGIDLSIGGMVQPTFSSPVSIAIDLPVASTTSGLAVYWWNSFSGVWSAAGISGTLVTGHHLTFNTTHFTMFSVFASVDLIPPQLTSLMVDEQLIATNDYVSARPELNAYIKESSAGVGLESCLLELFQSDGLIPILITSNLTVYPATKTLVRVMYRPPDPLPEETYFYRLTLKDLNNNTQIFNSPTFRIRELSFAMSALHGPNPFSPNGDGINDFLKITYQMSDDADVTIRIFDLAGSLVSSWRFIAGDHAGGISGHNEVLWDGRDASGATVSNGVYFAVLTAESRHQIKKRITLKIAVLK